MSALPPKADIAGRQLDVCFVLPAQPVDATHCCVPTFHEEGELKLGWWLATQRRTRKEMSAERRARLNKKGFVWNAVKAPSPIERAKRAVSHAGAGSRPGAIERALGPYRDVTRRIREAPLDRLALVGVFAAQIVIAVPFRTLR